MIKYRNKKYFNLGTSKILKNYSNIYGVIGVGDNYIRKKIHKEISMMDVIKLKTSRFDTITKKNYIDINKYNFWVVDLQGAELLALKGASESIRMCNFIFIEISKEDIYKGGANWNELNEFLKKKGFTPVWEPEEIHTDVLYIKK